MKKALILILALLFLCWPSLACAVAEKSGDHFNGVGVFIWNEIRLSGESAEVFAQTAKWDNLSFVVIKAYDGKKWGIKHGKAFSPQLTKEVVRAFHHQGIQCYGYGTAYLYAKSDVGMHIKNAIQTLHLGVDGLVIDDVFSYGTNHRQTEKLFKGIWSHCQRCPKCQGKAIAFSSFPHLNRRELPWKIPMRYSHYYLPQLYWVNLKLTPDQLFEKFQADWANFKMRTKNVRCQIIPVAQTFDRNAEQKVTPGALSRFFSKAKEKYLGVTFFRWKTTQSSKWEEIVRSARNWHAPQDNTQAVSQ
jgi:hypothetical protein